MKLLLWLFLLIAAGAAYYEYTWQQQTSAGFAQQLTAWPAKIAAIQADNDKLTHQNTSLSHEADQTQQEVAMLATQLSSMRGSMVDEQKTEALGVHPPDSTDLGTVTTLLGKTYPNCHLLKMRSDGIIVSYDGGITQIKFAFMPPDLQKRFGYDPQKAVLVNEANIRFQEQSQEAAKPAPATTSAPAAP